MNSVATRRFTIDEYHHLISAGILTENDGIELIRGELVKMAAKGTRHSVANTKLCRQLDRQLLDQAVVRNQEPIVLPNSSEPEPDVVIANGQADDYVEQHPTPPDIQLIIEVSDSTLEYDQSTKLAIYAEAAIAHYWIMNLRSDRLECYSTPYTNGNSGEHGYRSQQIFLPNEQLLIPGFADLFLDLTQIFPQPAG